MKTIMITRGDSGKWEVELRGQIVAHGHVPRSVPAGEIAKIIARQIIRQSAAINPEQPPMLGGGSLWEVEIPESVYAALEKRAADRLIGGTCWRCGTFHQFEEGRGGCKYFRCCGRSHYLHADGRIT